MKKNIIIGLFILLVLFAIKSYSKYAKEYRIEAIEIITDRKAPEYEIEYSRVEPTNEEVEIILTFSEEIENIDGFEKIDDCTYKRIIEENESKKIEISDLVRK